METSNKWWGYRHIDGSLKLKRYFGGRSGFEQLREASASPFISELIEPFKANSREEAAGTLREKTAVQ